MAGIFINSPGFFAIAKEAYVRARAEAGDERSPKSSEPLISIIFSAASAEAFINELGEIASNKSHEPKEIQTLGTLLSEVETSRGSIQLKFLVAKLALTGSSYNKGINPYQDFDTLIELRNSLMHLKFSRITSEKINQLNVHHPKIVNRLISKNILAVYKNDQNVIASWTDRVCTPAVARWACNATAGIVKDLVESIPSSGLDGLRARADLFYFGFNQFSPVE